MPSWSQIARVAVPTALLAGAGIALLVAADGTLAMAIGFALLSVAAVIATAAVFLAVGASEDRERAQQQASGRRPPLRLPRRLPRRRDHDPD